MPCFHCVPTPKKKGTSTKEYINETFYVKLFWSLIVACPVFKNKCIVFQFKEFAFIA